MDGEVLCAGEADQRRQKYSPMYGFCLRKNVGWDLVRLLKEEVVTVKDLEGFSQALRCVICQAKIVLLK